MQIRWINLSPDNISTVYKIFNIKYKVTFTFPSIPCYAIMPIHSSTCENVDELEKTLLSFSFFPFSSLKQDKKKGTAFMIDGEKVISPWDVKRTRLKNTSHKSILLLYTRIHFFIILSPFPTWCKISALRGDSRERLIGWY